MRWIGLAIATLFFATPAFACGTHGTNAGNDINDWLENNASSSSAVSSSNPDGTETGWADGGQSSRDDDGNEVAFHWEGGDSDELVGEDMAEEGSNAGTGMGNENYWVNIELPNGNTVTINTTPNAITDGGDAIELWLVEQGKEVIRDWFENYEPEDDQQGTFVG